jgi:hypothetical protein
MIITMQSKGTQNSWKQDFQFEEIVLDNIIPGI